MSDFLTEILICVLMSVTMLWIIGKYLDIFLIKKEKHISALLMWTLYFIYQFIAEYKKGNGSAIMIVMNIFLIFGICLVGYSGTIGAKLLYTVLVCVIGALIEMVTYFCLQCLIPSHTVLFNSFGSAISKTISIILVVLLNVKLKQYDKSRLPGKYIAVLMIIPIASVFIAYNIFFLDNEIGSLRSTLSFTLLLFLNCFIFDLCQKLYTNLEVEHENVVFARQLELITKHTREQEQQYDTQREFRHNLKNYCIGLRAKIEHHEIEDALSMIDTILMTEDIRGNWINTGNDVIDTLINYKYEIARRYNITMTADINVPSVISEIASGDLAIILGNLLDNAIEAAKECTENKFIDISIGNWRGELIICICNSFKDVPIKDKTGEFISLKRDYENHGFGIKSVKKAVEKYEGNIYFEIKDNKFTAIAITKNDKI